MFIITLAIILIINPISCKHLQDQLRTLSLFLSWSSSFSLFFLMASVFTDSLTTGRTLAPSGGSIYCSTIITLKQGGPCAPTHIYIHQETIFHVPHCWRRSELARTAMDIDAGSLPMLPMGDRSLIHSPCTVNLQSCRCPAGRSSFLFRRRCCFAVEAS